MDLMNTYVNSENKGLLNLYLTEARKQGYTWYSGAPLYITSDVKGCVGLYERDSGFSYNLQEGSRGISCLKELTLTDFNTKRQIIQIIDSPSTESNQGCLLALCNDGTVWFLQDGRWSPLGEQIPQDDFSTILKDGVYDD